MTTRRSMHRGASRRGSGVRQHEPLVSVITPAHDCEAYLHRCLESVQSQTVGDWEHVVVDDGSSDGTLELAESAAKREPRLRVLRHPDHGNHGVSASRNLAMERARGTFVAFLDADDSWLEHKLERQLEVLCRDDPPVLSFARAVCVDEADQPLEHPEWPQQEWVIGHAPAPGSIADPSGAFLTARVSIPIVTAVAPLQKVRAVGGFAEGFRYQVEDAAMLARLCRIGPAHYTDEILARYRVHGGSFTATLTSLSEVDAAWELYVHLIDGAEPVEPELERVMLGCIDRYLFARDVSSEVRWRRIRHVARRLEGAGVASVGRVGWRLATAAPRRLKQQVMIRLRRRLGVGPAPWRSLLVPRRDGGGHEGARASDDG